jgi:hypothetical protein
VFVPISALVTEYDAGRYGERVNCRLKSYSGRERDRCGARIAGTLSAHRLRLDQDFLLPKLLGHSKASVNFGRILVDCNIMWISLLIDLPHDQTEFLYHGE